MGDHAKPRARIDNLDALRGICALSVAFFHFETTGALTNLAFFRHSWILVDFFFVLSGFVITAAYAEDLRQGYSITRFLLLRLARILPLHLVMIALFLVLELSKLIVQVGPAVPLFAPPRELGSLVTNLLLLQVFGIYDHLTWNAPSWSIAAEFWVYGIAALAFRFGGDARNVLLLIVAALCAGAMALNGAPFLNLTYDGAVVRCLYGFAIGSLTWTVVARDAVRTAKTLSTSDTVRASIVELAVVGAAVLAICLVKIDVLTIGFPPLFGLCVLVLARQGGILSSLLGRSGPVWLGSISYSIYMTHAFVEGRVLDLLSVAGKVLGMVLVQRVVVDGAAKKVLVGSELFVNTTVVALVLLLVAISAASYRFVEQPCNRWARARIRQAQPLSRPAVA